ncbi:MAG: hypothetical protein ACR2OO_11360 [Thermomicrobiales bacterium]
MTVRLLRGRFERRGAASALAASGYATIQDGAQTIFSLAEDGMIVYGNQANALALASFNNVAFLPDGTLAAASRLDSVWLVLATAVGKAPSLADNPQVVTLFAAIDAAFASALILTGDVISSLPRLTPIAEPGIAPFVLALTGVTPGGPEVAGAASPQAASSPGTTPPGPLWKWALLAADRNVAATVAKLIPRHIESGRSLRSNEPYTDLFAFWSTAVAPDGPVALFDIVTAPPRASSLWIRMIQFRDIAFLA